MDMSSPNSSIQERIKESGEDCLYDTDFITETTRQVSGTDQSDLVSFLNIAEWGEEKEQSGDASSESSDLEKKQLPTNEIKSIEVYKWIVPVGNMKSIIAQLKSLTQSVEKKTDVKPIDVLRFQAKVVCYLNKSYMEQIEQSSHVSPKPLYFNPSAESSNVQVPTQIEPILTAFSSFSLRILELANHSYKDFFNQIYPEVAASLCNVPPFSLMKQPDVIHDTYARIQRFLGAISLDSGSDPELQRSALLSQIGISLARGTTDAILS
ncbi:hypothetical protein WA538_002430, partial [Blastocystis sp. DL]